MKKLCIGIQELTSGWQVILDQVGVWYEKLSYKKDLSSSYSSIILNALITEKEEEKLHHFVEQGGTVLETQLGECFSFARFTTTKKVERILNHGKFPFLRHIPFLDIHTKAELYNGQDDFKGLIDFEPYGKGAVCNLGINPDEIVANNKCVRKRFFFKTGMHPDELVSKVSKASLTELIVTILKELHFFQKLPFVCKWTSPKEQPIFAFRIDSDYGEESTVRALAGLGKKQNVPMTWFLHVAAHEDWLPVFHEFKAQEIALHGYEHGTSESYENIFNNIEKGLQLLKDADFDPKGFCVPYSIWNDSLAEVLQKFEFEYTSEFSVGYDGLPFYPIHNNELQSCLQIPVHPVCTGNLSRIHGTEEDMKDYFLQVLEAKLARFEPVVFYHHPLQKGMNIWEEVFMKINDLNLTKLSFLEYAAFWKKRLETQIEAVFDPNTRSLTFSKNNSDLFIQVSSDHASFELVKPGSESDLRNTHKFEYHTRTLPDNNTLNEMSSNRLQLFKISLLDRKNRKRL